MRTTFKQLLRGYLIVCGACAMVASGSEIPAPPSWAVVTQTQSVTHQPGSLYLNVVGSTDETPSITVPLSGTGLRVPLHYQSGSSKIQVQTQWQIGTHSMGVAAQLSAFSLSPFSSISIPLMKRPEDIVYSIIPDEIENPFWELVTVGVSESGGYIAFHRDSVVEKIPLAGEPVQVIPLHNTQKLVVLIRRPDSGEYALQLCELDQRKAVLPSIDLPVDKKGLGFHPVTLSTDAANGHVYILTAGHNFDETGDIPSQMIVFDIQGNRWLPGSIRLQGRAEFHEHPLVGGEDSECYVLLRDPAREFGYVYRVSVLNETLQKTFSLSFSGVQNPMRAVFDSRDERLTLGVNNRVLTYIKGELQGKALEFKAPISALAQSGSYLAVGEGGRLHIAAGLERSLIQHVQFQHGRVVDMIPISIKPEAVISRENVMPHFPPRIRLPYKQFGKHRSTLWAGRGLANYKVAEIAASLSGNMESTYHEDSNGDQWLTLEYQYPESAERVPVLGGAVKIERTIKLPDGQAIQNYSTVYLDAPDFFERDSVPRILWVNSGGIPKSMGQKDSFSKIRQLLSQPPLSISHSTTSDNEWMDWAAYDVVIVPITSVSLGVLSRQHLMEYIVNGGVVVWLGEALPEEEFQNVARWLEPLGMHILPFNAKPLELSGRRLRTGFSAPQGHRVPEGSLVRTNVQNNLLVSSLGNAETGLMAYRDYGLGRFLYLSSAAWLSDAMVADAAGVRFVQYLFEWLVDAGRDAVDMDGDGLSDAAEDINGNGRVDPGETDFYRYDTDNDGVGDGLEDINMNGRTEAGETNPLYADTNQNGIWDGSDVSPLPKSGSPYIQSVNPATAPVEGGDSIIIEGRNLASGMNVYFGTALSPEVTLLNSENMIAIVPAGNRGLVNKPMDVRVGNSSYEVEGILEDAFTFSPPSKVELSMSNLAFAVKQYGIYTGRTAIHLRPGFAKIGRIEFEIQVDPAVSVVSMNVKPSKRVGQAKRTFRVYEQEPGSYRIEVSNGLPMALDVPIFSFDWVVDCTAKATRTVTWRIDSPVIYEQFGGIYVSTSQSYVYNVGPSPL